MAAAPAPAPSNGSSALPNFNDEEEYVLPPFQFILPIPRFDVQTADFGLLTQEKLRSKNGRRESSFLLEEIPHTSAYDEWIKPLLLQEVRPAQIPARSYFIIGVKNDGWCMYRSWAYAHSSQGKNAGPFAGTTIETDISVKQLWRLAHGMVAKMREVGYDAEGTDDVRTASGQPKIDAGGRPVKGWPTQIPARQGADYILVNGSKRQFVLKDSLYDGLLTLFNPNDITKGPLVYPTNDMLRYLDMLLPNAITFTYGLDPASPAPKYYDNLTGKIDIECQDSRLCTLNPSKDLYSAVMVPDSVKTAANALILHTGGNHFSVLKVYKPRVGKPLFDTYSGTTINSYNIDALTGEDSLTPAYKAKHGERAAAGGGGWDVPEVVHRGAAALLQPLPEGGGAAAGGGGAAAGSGVPLVARRGVAAVPPESKGERPAVAFLPPVSLEAIARAELPQLADESGGAPAPQREAPEPAAPLQPAPAEPQREAPAPAAPLQPAPAAPQREAPAPAALLQPAPEGEEAPAPAALLQPAPEGEEAPALQRAAELLVVGAENLLSIMKGSAPEPDLHEQVAALPDTNWDKVLQEIAALPEPEAVSFTQAVQAAQRLYDMLRGIGSLVNDIKELGAQVQPALSVALAQVDQTYSQLSNIYGRVWQLLQSKTYGAIPQLVQESETIQPVLLAGLQEVLSGADAIYQDSIEGLVEPPKTVVPPREAAKPMDLAAKQDYVSRAYVAWAAAQNAAAEASVYAAQNPAVKPRAEEAQRHAQEAYMERMATELAETDFDVITHFNKANMAAWAAIAIAKELNAAGGSGAAAAGGGDQPAGGGDQPAVARAKLAAEEIKKEQEKLKPINTRAMYALELAATDNAALDAIPDVSDAIKANAAEAFRIARGEAIKANEAALSGSGRDVTLEFVRQKIAEATVAAGKVEAAAKRVREQLKAAHAEAAARIVQAEAEAKAAATLKGQKEAARRAAAVVINLLTFTREALTYIQGIEGVADGILQQVRGAENTAQQQLELANRAAQEAEATQDLAIATERAGAAREAAKQALAAAIVAQRYKANAAAEKATNEVTTADEVIGAVAEVAEMLGNARLAKDAAVAAAGRAALLTNFEQLLQAVGAAVDAERQVAAELKRARAAIPPSANEQSEIAGQHARALKAATGAQRALEAATRNLGAIEAARPALDAAGVALAAARAAADRAGAATTPGEAKAAADEAVAAAKQVNIILRGARTQQRQAWRAASGAPLLEGEPPAPGGGGGQGQPARPEGPPPAPAPGGGGGQGQPARPEGAPAPGGGGGQGQPARPEGAPAPGGGGGQGQPARPEGPPPAPAPGGGGGQGQPARPEGAPARPEGQPPARPEGEPPAPAPARPSALGRLRVGLGGIAEAVKRATASPAPLPPRRARGAPLPELPPNIRPIIGSLEVPAAAPLEVRGGVAGIFVLDGSNNLYVHVRGPVAAPAVAAAMPAPAPEYAGKLGIPMGDMKEGEDAATAAIRELAEEAQLAPAPERKDLKLIYTATLDGNKPGKFYLYRLPAEFTIAGPQADHVNEVVIPFPAADIAESNRTFAPHGYIGATPDNILQFLNSEAGGAMSSPFMLGALAAVRRYATTGQLSLGAQPLDVPEGDVPRWATGYFDVASMRDCTGDGDFIGPECASRAIYRDIMVAEEFKKTGRLSVRPNSRAEAYNKLVAEIAAETDPVALKTKQAQMDEDYGDISIWIKDPESGVQHALPLPNPYRAMAEREQATTFANPSGGASAKNVAVLQALVGPKGKEMLEDSKFATSLLEALWFCGQGHVMNDKARCYPAMVLAELREQELAKSQKKAGEIAKELKWPLVVEWGKKLMSEFEGIKAIHAAAQPAPIAGAPAPAAEEGAEAGGAAPAAAGGAAPARTKPAGAEASRFGTQRGHAPNSTSVVGAFGSRSL